ncbi:hypothetical protein RRG08_012658 [Elysia crispata]|uniref:Uncharacterized protein n=1 Tax=Elysia crispata TaxID=231223 RepID=A0AAE0YMK4_9GAST|nr:hypothetical protein RRG08_012658 [Elysia crispata]
MLSQTPQSGSVLRNDAPSRPSSSLSPRHLSDKSGHKLTPWVDRHKGGPHQDNYYQQPTLISLDIHLLGARTRVHGHNKRHCVSNRMKLGEKNNRTAEHFKGLRMSTQLPVFGDFSGLNSWLVFP